MQSSYLHIYFVGIRDNQIQHLFHIKVTHFENYPVLSSSLLKHLPLGSNQNIDIVEHVVLQRHIHLGPNVGLNAT